MTNFVDYETLSSQIPLSVALSATIFMVLSVVAMWKIFQKAGRPAWAAIVPFYNMYVLFDLAWGKGWFFLLTIIPFVNAVVGILCSLKLAKAFDKSVGFGIGLMLLNPIFMLMLGFGDAQYRGAAQN